MTIKLSSVFEYALKVFLFVSAIFYLPFNGQGDAVQWGYITQDLFFRYGTIVLFAISCMAPRVRQMTFQSFPMLLVVVVLTALMFGFNITLRAGILNLFIGLVFYKLVYESIQFERLKTFAWWFGWLLFLNLCWCSLQWLGHDPLFTHLDGAIAGKLDTIVGFVRLKVHLGILAALLTPMIVCYAPCFLLCVIPLIVFSQSSTAALALIVSGIVLGWHRAKNFTLLLLSFALLAFGVWFIFMFDMPGGQFGERFKVWQYVLSVSLKHFAITGAGIGTFKTLNVATMQQNGTPLSWMWVHNEFLQGFYEFGALGMAFIVAYIIKIHKKAQELMKEKAVLALYASFISILILSCVQFPWHLSRFVPIMLFLMASLHARLEEPKYV